MNKKIKTKKKKQKWRILKFDESNIDLGILNAVHIEIFGDSKISIEGCIGVYEYKETYLKLRLIKGTVIICGSDFNIIYFENRLISVKGKISAIEFV